MDIHTAEATIVDTTAIIDNRSTAIIESATAFADFVRENYAVTDAASAELAGTVRQQIQEKIKDIGDHYGPDKALAHKLHLSISSKERQALGPLEAARDFLNGELRRWHDEQERQARLERQRVEAENKRVEEERRLQEAEQLEKQGEKKEAEKVLQAPLILPPTQAAPAPKVESVQFRDNWKGEVTDFAAFVAHIAANPALLNLLQPNETAINQTARAQKELLSIPGLRVWNDRVVASSRRR
jgi:hypothetical protein